MRTAAASGAEAPLLPAGVEETAVTAVADGTNGALILPRLPNFRVLRVLSLTSCGIADLAWLTPALATLEHLSLRNNLIVGGLDACRPLQRLKELILSGNRVSDFNELRGLSPLRRLRLLDLRWNDVRETPDFAKLACALIPSLRLLDEECVFNPPHGQFVVSPLPWESIPELNDDDDLSDEGEEDDDEGDPGSDSNDESDSSSGLVVLADDLKGGEAPAKRPRLVDEAAVAQAVEELSSTSLESSPSSSPSRRTAVATAAAAAAAVVSPRAAAPAASRPVAKTPGKSVAKKGGKGNAVPPPMALLYRPWKRPNCNFQGESE